MDIIIGLNPVSAQAPSEGSAFKPGTLGSVSDPVTGNVRDFMYVFSAAGSTAAGDVMVVNPLTYSATLLTSANGAAGAGTGFPVGVAQTAIPAGGWGWIQIYGATPIRVTAASAIGTQLNTTATGGGLSTTATAATTSRLTNMALTVAAGGAGVSQGYVTYPVVGQVN